MATEENMEECRRRKISAVLSAETTDMFLILPSYAELHKAEIKNILAIEKAKLCNTLQFKNIFQHVNFRIFFAKSRNIKKIIARTKIKTL